MYFNNSILNIKKRGENTKGFPKSRNTDAENLENDNAKRKGRSRKILMTSKCDLDLLSIDGNMERFVLQ